MTPIKTHRKYEAGARPSWYCCRWVGENGSVCVDSHHEWFVGWCEHLNQLFEHCSLDNALFAVACRQHLEIDPVLDLITQLLHQLHVDISLHERHSDFFEHIFQYIIVDNGCLRHLADGTCDFLAKICEHHFLPCRLPH